MEARSWCGPQFAAWQLRGRAADGYDKAVHAMDCIYQASLSVERDHRLAVGSVS